MMETKRDWMYNSIVMKICWALCIVILQTIYHVSRFRCTSEYVFMYHLCLWESFVISLRKDIEEKNWKESSTRWKCTKKKSRLVPMPVSKIFFMLWLSIVWKIKWMQCDEQKLKLIQPLWASCGHALLDR